MNQVESEWDYTLQNIEEVPQELLTDFEIPEKTIKRDEEELELSCKFLNVAKYRDQLPDTSKFKYAETKYYLTVNGNDGEPIAVVILTLTPSGDRDYYHGNSSVIVKDEERGKGIASALIEPSKKMLQQLASQLGKPIELEVRNQNLETLHQLQSDPEATADEIALKKQEQERWQKLYGSDGKLGTKEGSTPQIFRIVFSPDKATEEIVKSTKSAVDEILD
jgi:hypothetical protein